MAHHTYLTKGLILRVLPSGEANRRVVVFTKEFGLISAVAQGARKVSSKTHFALTQFSVADFSFIYGKGGWRIINVVAGINFYALFKEDERTGSEKVRLLAQISALLEKLCAGEEKNHELSESLFLGLSFLHHHTLKTEEVYNVERVMVLRMLFFLGYMPHTSYTVPFITDTNVTDETLFLMEKHKRDVTRQINISLKQTML